jgi:hypothetical protein
MNDEGAIVVYPRRRNKNKADLLQLHSCTNRMLQRLFLILIRELLSW